MNPEFEKSGIFTMHLKRPALGKTLLLPLLIGFMIGGSGVFLKIIFSGDFMPPMFIKFFIIYIIVIMALAVTAVMLLKPKSGLKIEFHPDHLVLPAKVRLSKSAEISYSDIYSIVERKNRKHRFIHIDTRKKPVIYNLTEFTEPTTYESFTGVLKNYVTAQPDGELHWKSIEERNRLYAEGSKRKGLATWLFSGIILFIFIIEMFMGVINNPMILLDLGANAPELVKDGQWFRLFNSNFLHLDYLHIFFNIICLVIVGILVERLTGLWNFVLIFLYSALAGAVLSMTFNHALFSVGASTALYGLIGALVVINVKYGKRLPAGYRIPGRNWIFFVVLTVIFKFIFPGTDDAAHAGGFIAGLVITYFLYKNDNRIFLSLKQKEPARILNFIIMALFIFSGLAGLLHLKGGDEPDIIKVARAYRDIPDAKPGLLNNLSWSVITRRQESREVIRFARRLSEKAVEKEPEEPEYIDTLATSCFLLGMTDDAIRMERSALAIKGKKFYATQLSFFILSKKETDIPLIVGADPAPAVEFSSDWKGTGKDTHLEIRATFKNKYKKAVAYLKQTRNGSDAGIIRMVINNPDERSYYFSTRIKDAGSDYRLKVLLIDTGESSPEVSERNWMYWFYDREVPEIYKKVL